MKEDPAAPKNAQIYCAAATDGGLNDKRGRKAPSSSLKNNQRA